LTRFRPALLLAGAALLLAATAARGAHAQQRLTLPGEPVPRISLAEALGRMEANNLELRVAREEIAGADGRLTAAGALQNPGISLTREQLSGAPGGYHETTLTLGQPLELAGQRGLRRDVAGRWVDAARERLEGTRQRLAFEVHRAYLRTASAEARLAALAGAAEVFRVVTESGRARFAEGDVSRFEHERLRFEQARYEVLVSQALLELDQSARTLALLVSPPGPEGSERLLPSGPLAAPAAAPEAAPGGLEAALVRARSRGDLRAAEAEVAAAEAALSLQRRLRVPDLNVLAGFKHQADGQRGAVLGVSFALPLWNRNAGGVAEAEAGLNAARGRRDLLLQRAESDVRGAWRALRAAEERLQLADRLMPDARSLLDIAQVAYAEGEMTLVALLDAADVYRSASESMDALRLDYWTALSDLERATGRLLDPRPASSGASR